MFFKSTEHMERFLDVIEGIGQVHNGQIDLEYGAAVYILTADLEIWGKSKQYIDAEGIAFGELLADTDFSGGYTILVKLAGNLFNNGQHLDPLDLIGLDEDNFKAALTAMQLRRYQTHLEDITMSGRPQTKERDRIRELRKQGMTREAIARELNVSISTVVRHTRGI